MKAPCLLMGAPCLLACLLCFKAPLPPDFFAVLWGPLPSGLFAVLWPPAFWLVCCALGTLCLLTCSLCFGPPAFWLVCCALGPPCLLTCSLCFKAPCLLTCLLCFGAPCLLACLLCFVLVWCWTHPQLQGSLNKPFAAFKWRSDVNTLFSKQALSPKLLFAQGMTYVGLAKTIYIYSVYTVVLAGKSPNIRSYTLYTYGYGQP